MNSLAATVAAKFDEVNAALADSPYWNGLVQGGLSLMPPPFGPALVGVLGGRAAELAEKNSKRLIEEIKEDINSIDEAKVDWDFMDSEEFSALLIDILIANARTYEEQKVKLFARFFVNLTLREHSTTRYKEGFLRIVSDLSSDHAALFALIHRRLKKLAEDEKVEAVRVNASDLVGQIELSEDRILAYSEELIRYGLLRDFGIAKYGYRPGSYTVTGYGEEFASFLRKTSQT